MRGRTKGLLQAHVAVFFFGLAGLFGKFLTLPPAMIVLGRTFFAALSLGLVLLYLRKSLRFHSPGDLLSFLGIGGILALHWMTFFHSIQISTVAVGLITFSTFPVFVTFIEPYFFKERLRTSSLIQALLVLMGVILVVPGIDVGNNVTRGAFWGIASGLTFAFLSILNRRAVKSYPSTFIAFYQNAFATVILLPFLHFRLQEVTLRDLLLLIFLGILCTALAHALFIKAMGHIHAQLASIIVSLEPVYGVFFAFLLLGEVPTIRCILGGSIILGTTVFGSYHEKARQPEPGNAE